MVLVSLISYTLTSVNGFCTILAKLPVSTTSIARQVQIQDGAGK